MDPQLLVLILTTVFPEVVSAQPLLLHTLSQTNQLNTCYLLRLLPKMIKKRSRPQQRIREISIEREDVVEAPQNEEESSLPYVSTFTGFA